YCAGFNVDPSFTDTQRIDCELEDLNYLSSKGARIAILSHQGSYRKGTALHLDFLCDYLSRRLEKCVRYFPENNTDQSITCSRSLENGEIALFGNTRLHAGEETGDEHLAAQFARLGDFVAVGGVSKAHRLHASNVKILSLLPAYATTNLLTELKLLNHVICPFPGKSVAILGGIKLEKITKGLSLFKAIYDFVIPAGAVLNHILKEMDFSIGDSVLCDEPEVASKIVSKVLLETERAELLLPEELIIAERKSMRNPRKITLDQAVPQGCAIVDFIVGQKMEKAFLALSQEPVRLLMAGTPSLVNQGFRTSSDAFIQWMSLPRVTPFIMGGDTMNDLSFNCPSSTGGGAALYYLKEKNCPLLEALLQNQIRWGASSVF
ncbi:MAG: phosphoglycerate kinase, partial [Verrucomicrobia bacterium]|nr:phosphoglycerate kinase [Verrucomicrobiota bacterium]